VQNGADAMSAREAMEIATRGGADVLGRPECGRIAVGKRADIAIWDISGIESAGSWDPAALVIAGSNKVRHLFVEGRQIVRDWNIVTLDLPKLIEAQNRLALKLAG
jgi:cytosine/adenosine deaminase-related metal-dependent hydrolase